jgi:hypothetical protein
MTAQISKPTISDVAKIIDIDAKTITIGKNRYNLLMAYLCPICKEPILCLFQSDSKKVTPQEIGNALQDRGFNAYRIFETIKGQGFEYDEGKDPKKRHSHHDDSESYSYTSSEKYYQLFTQLNPQFSISEFISYTYGRYFGQIPKNAPTAIRNLEVANKFMANLKKHPEMFLLSEDICGHGKPIFFLNMEKWNKTVGNYDAEQYKKFMMRIFGSDLLKQLNLPTPIMVVPKLLKLDITDNFGVVKKTNAVKSIVPGIGNFKVELDDGQIVEMPEELLDDKFDDDWRAYLELSSLEKPEENPQSGLRVGKPRKVDDEWVVPVYKDGKRDEAKTYYTPDKDDAYNTYSRMVREIEDPSGTHSAMIEQFQSNPRPEGGFTVQEFIDKVIAGGGDFEQAKRMFNKMYKERKILSAMDKASGRYDYYIMAKPT